MNTITEPRRLLTWNRADAEHHFERSKHDQATALWRAIAKDLAESGSAIVAELRRDRKPSPFVISLFLEACKEYDRLNDGGEK